MGLTDCVMNEISSSATLVPMLIRIATPIVSRNSTGSIQEVVEMISSKMMMGIKIIIALSTSDTDMSCVDAVFTASPDTALSSPISA